MQKELLDQFESVENDEPRSYDYAVLYAKYVLVCIGKGVVLVAGLFSHLHYPFDRVVGIGMMAIVILLLIFALIGVVHSLRSYWRKEQVSRVRIGVMMLHLLIVLGYIVYCIVMIEAVIHLNPTAI